MDDETMLPEEARLVARVTGVLTSALDLEILIILMEDPTRWWDVRAMSAEVVREAAAVRNVLDRLCAENLLDIKATDDVRYRYRPGTPQLVAAGEALMAAYRRSAVRWGS